MQSRRKLVADLACKVAYGENGTKALPDKVRRPDRVRRHVYLKIRIGRDKSKAQFKLYILFAQIVSMNTYYNP